MKKIGLICLCLASLNLVGCFHVPDEDWLPSKNKVETENIQKDGEVEDAINSLTDGIDMISSQRNEIKNNENDEIIEENGEIIEENENVENNEDQEIIDNTIVEDTL